MARNIFCKESSFIEVYGFKEYFLVAQCHTTFIRTQGIKSIFSGNFPDKYHRNILPLCNILFLLVFKGNIENLCK